jgi:hypothetical protein
MLSVATLTPALLAKLDELGLPAPLVDEEQGSVFALASLALTVLERANGELTQALIALSEERAVMRDLLKSIGHEWMCGDCQGFIYRIRSPARPHTWLYVNNNGTAHYCQKGTATNDAERE